MCGKIGFKIQAKDEERASIRCRSNRKWLGVINSFLSSILMFSHHALLSKGCPGICLTIRNGLQPLYVINLPHNIYPIYHEQFHQIKLRNSKIQSRMSFFKIKWDFILSSGYPAKKQICNPSFHLWCTI